MKSISVDIYIEDVYYNMDKHDKKVITEMLEEDGYCVSIKKETKGEDGLLDKMWKEEIVKLMNNRHNLTTDDENTILNIIKGL